MKTNRLVKIFQEKSMNGRLMTFFVREDKTRAYPPNLEDMARILSCLHKGTAEIHGPISEAYITPSGRVL